jgi:two-component system, sensor histidine kinase and response regulator
MSVVDYAVDVDMNELADGIKLSGDNWEELIQNCEFNFNDKIEIFDIKNLINEIISQFKAYIQDKKNELILESNTIIFLKLDREKMSLILRHILRNAIIYSHNNSKINIKIIEDQGYCNIAIEDRGVGISDDLLPTIFPDHDSHTSKNESSSYSKNIGLSQCRDWILEMGGSVSIQSKLNHGTIVYISIPTLNIVDDKKS